VSDRVPVPRIIARRNIGGPTLRATVLTDRTVATLVPSGPRFEGRLLRVESKSEPPLSATSTEEE